MGLGAALLGALVCHSAQAICNGLSIQHHAAAAAIGVIVRLALFVFGIIPDLVAVRFKQVFGAGTA